MNNIIFIRHGSTLGNLEKRYIGKTDEALCEQGISEILELKKHKFRADRLFVSPMKRAVQSAKILFPEMTPEIIDDFRETDFGIFEGKTANELSDDVRYRCWVDSFCMDDIPEGESVRFFKQRCQSAFLKAVRQCSDGEDIVFVVHGGTIMSILEAFAYPKKSYYDYHIKNGGFIQCQGWFDEKTGDILKVISEE